MTGLGANKEQKNRSALVSWGSPWSCWPAPVTEIFGLAATDTGMLDVSCERSRPTRPW